MSGGGGGGTTSTTVTQSNIPDWLQPQVETLLGAAGKELFTWQKDENGNYVATGTKPYKPFSTNAADYVANYNPLQLQAAQSAQGLQVPGQFAQGTQLANAAGQGALDSAQQAYGYGAAGSAAGRLGQQLGIAGGQQYGSMGAGYGGQAAALAPQAQTYGSTGADIGQMGLRAEALGRDVSSQAQNYAQQAAGVGDLYANLATNPAAYKAYMSPYTQNVVDQQAAAAIRQSDIAGEARRAAAARAGAFGGSRQAIEDSEANRALQTQLSGIQAQGLQQAYQQAQNSIQNQAQFQLQGLQGAQAGLGTALQGGQLGLSGIGQAMAGQQLGLQGLQAANQLYGTGIQGAQAGLQGVQAQLAGTAQGMQGAQVGLQGVSGAQAGYGLANQSASTLGQLGAQQLAAQTDIIGQQAALGAQGQAHDQAVINQAVQNYAMQQEAPYNAMAQYNALLRGYAVPGQTISQYSAQPSLASQVAGLGTAGVGLAGLTKRTGGKIDTYEGIDKLALRKALKGALR